MKKIITLILALTLVFALAACGADNGGSNADAPETALELLETVWNSYPDDEKFAVAGGDYENSVMDAPGKFSISDATVLDSMLALPESQAASIDDAASLMHMMNSNTFTCGAFHVTDSANVSAVATALKDNILARQWMCGFPDKVIIITLGDYVISFFGNGEAVDNFSSKLSAAYSSAVVFCDEPII